MSTEALSKAVIEAADQITADDVETDLYIDFNGGLRDVAFMIYSIANLMKLRNVTVRQILTMNYENPVTKLVGGVEMSGILIEVRNAVFESVDLIAAINEYVKYGRIQGLREYFDIDYPSNAAGAGVRADGRMTAAPEDDLSAFPAGDERKQLLDQMEEFAGNLQLCRTDYIMSHKEELNQALCDYAERGGQLSVAAGHSDSSSPITETTAAGAGAEEGTIHDQLFRYVIKDIQRGYQGLLDGNLPDIIEWCVRHDYIQQAVTFCSEKLSWYFWNQGICRPSDAEAQEYWKIRDAIRQYQDIDLRKASTLSRKARTLSRGYYSNLPSHAAGELETCDARYAYEWLIDYLPQSRTAKYTHFLEALPAGQAGNLSLRSRGLSQADGKKLGKDMIKNYMKPGNDVTIHVKDATATDQYILEIVGKNNGNGKSAVTMVHRIKASKGQIENAAGNTAGLLYQRQMGRVQTNVGDQRFREILLLYYLLKAQRNELNHADGSTEGWPFLQLREVVFHMARLLRS